VIPDVPQMCTVLACSHHQPTKGTQNVRNTRSQ